LYSGAKVYAHDTYAPGFGTSLNSVLVLTGGDVISSLLTSTKPVWNSGLTARSTANNAVYDRILKYSGARPNDRDSPDKRVIASVKGRSGQIINCVSSNGTTRCQKNAGGWPSMTQTTRRLTLPSNPSSVASNGYTKLENWLHSLDQSIQGVTQSDSPIAPALLSVR
jgi:hypothetical protein